MARLYGNIQGLSPSQSKRLLNLYRRKISEIIIPQQALDLARLSFELNRLIALLLTRRGEVSQVIVGSADSLPQPLLERETAAPKRQQNIYGENRKTQQNGRGAYHLQAHRQRHG